MHTLAIISGVLSAISFVFALWDHNFTLAVANFTVIVWTILYFFKP